MGVHSRANFNDLSDLTECLKYITKYYTFSTFTLVEVHVLKDAITVFSQYSKRITGKYSPSSCMKKQNDLNHDVTEYHNI